MPRKAEIQAEETAVGSPLRRSNRKAHTNSLTPASLSTRRTSQTQNEVPKTRRASLSQENSDKDEKIDSKPATRGRKASTTKEEPETKPEPARTRGRRSSASTEPNVEESKPQTTTRRRRSSTTEDLPEAEPLKPIRTRRGSATEKPPEEEPAKKTRARRSSVKDEEPKEEPVKRATRGRKGSVDTAENTEPKEKKPNTRGRRLSTDELESEPETKAIKLTPVKSRRRLSVTENTVNLEPIEEVESEIKSRSSNSPVINLTPLRPAKQADVIGNLNLSIINETSIVEETQDDKDKCEEGTVTPRRSPRLSKNKQKAVKLTSPSSSPISHLIMEEDQSSKPKGKDLNKEEESAKEHLESSPKKLNFTDTEEMKKIEKGAEDEVFPEEMETTPEKEQIKKNEDKYLEEKLDKSSVSKTLTEVENCNISMGSDGSFKFHLNVSISASQNESIQEKDDLNSSKSSNTSDKENVSANTVSTPKKSTAEDKEQILNSLTNTPTNEKNLIQEEVVVARVSNVFQPKMKENSFMEPMEVDEYPSILDSEQGEPEESNIGDVLATSTITTKDNFKDIEIQEELINKNIRKSLTDVDSDLVGDSFYLNLSNGGEENEEKAKDSSQSVSQDESKVKISENICRDEHIKLVPLDVEGSTKQVDEKLETFDEDITNNEMKSHIFEENISRKPKTSSESHNAAVELDLKETTTKNILEQVQAVKETPLSTLSDTLMKNNDVEPEHIRKQKVKSSQCDTNYEHLETSEGKRSKSPSFIHVQTENKKKSLSRKSNSPQPHSSRTELTGKVSNSRKSKSPQPTEPVSRKSRSPQLSLRKSKSPLSENEKLSRKSKSPKSPSSPNDKVDAEKEKTLRRSKSPQSTNLHVKEQNEGKLIKSVSLSPVQQDSIPIEDVDTSSLNAENEMDESGSSVRESNEKSTFQGRDITDVTLSPTVDDEKNVDDISTSPGNSIDQFEEGILLRKLKSPLIKTKNQTDDKISSPIISVNFLEKDVNISPSANIEEQVNKIDYSDVQEKSGVNSKNSLTESREGNVREEKSLNQTKESCLNRTFSATESPSSQNLKISDIEVEVKRRSSSPVTLTRSKSPQSDSTMPEKLLKLDKNSTEATNFQSEKIENTEQTKDQINKINTEIHKDLAEKSESFSSNHNELKDTESKQSSDAVENSVNMTLKEPAKSDTLDDYDFELPSDEEEAEKTHAPEYDQSTVVTSYIATSQIIGDVSTSTEMETVVLVNKKKVDDSEVFEKDNSPLGKDPASPQSSKEKFELESDTDLDKNPEGEEILDNISDQDKIEKPKDDRCSENSNELKDEFIDEVQSQEMKEQDEIVNEEKISNLNMDSPQKKLKVRKYSLKKKMESYEEDMERSKKDKKDSEEESEVKLHHAKAMKKSRKRCRVVEKDIEKDKTVSDDDLDLEVAETKSPKKKSKNHIQKRESVDIENIAKQKKVRKPKEFVTKRNENIEDTKSIDRKSAKKKIISPKPLKYSTSEEDSELEKDTLDNIDLGDTTTFQKHNKRMSKKQIKSVSPKMSKTKEKDTDFKDRSKKSPTSILDDFVTKKIAEMASDEESFSEDENPDEPNDYLYTMAEEGEEDTPSEDSNAIIDEGESVGSTESEYGSNDDEYDENDSFICDDEEQQLLSGEEYDLDNEKRKKKSRIIQLDNYNDDIIKIQKKGKIKPVEQKKSRIISITDSSDSDEGQAEVNDSEDIIKTSEECNEIQTVVCVEEKTDDEVFIVETKPTSTSLEESPNVSTIESPGIQQRTEKRRLSSITIHENIDVREIKDAPLSERISHLVDSFCTSMRKGEISMNLSIECCANENDVSEEETTRNKRSKKRRLSRSSSTVEISKSIDSEDNVNSEEENTEEEISYKPPKRLSVSMDNSNLTEAKKTARKKRKLSKSMDNLDQIESKNKKKKTSKKKKKNVEKKAIKSPKRCTLLEDGLSMRSLGLINQLITDIKNRPRRTVKPSTNMNNSWITEVAHVKPSTTAFDKEEKAAYKAGKVHPKDFRTRMLNDPSRVRRIETKALLKKKGVHL